MVKKTERASGVHDVGELSLMRCALKLPRDDRVDVPAFILSAERIGNQKVKSLLLQRSGLSRGLRQSDSAGRSGAVDPVIDDMPTRTNDVSPQKEEKRGRDSIVKSSRVPILFGTILA